MIVVLACLSLYIRFRTVCRPNSFSLAIVFLLSSSANKSVSMFGLCLFICVYIKLAYFRFHPLLLRR